MILLNGIVLISFAGTKEPVAYGELISIWGIGLSVNGKLILETMPRSITYFYL
ncbi:putative macrophage migration inhibitory factor [Rosa chinensis]|uniref:Putative macrophage migration inhibitory factor n=1 Tax=Rosa chinensis TaxID=74649 RepID=A0A2P6QRY5_ROSCH|nr:putative macrophage migration inhibitory factor [Rosa chinensis]